MTSVRLTPHSAPTCPRCGADNDCAVARSGRIDTPCWCAGIVIARDVVDGLPEALRGVACLCRRCATGGDAYANPASDERATR
jgi:hypothetical protein